MPDVRERLQSGLAGRYHIEGEAGAGGTATVYIAEDLKHRRKVALKVFRRDLGTSLGPERFLREISIAAQLQHPHILPLYDSGQVDGLLYYVMPFIDGPSLRQRLLGEGELSIPEAVRLLRDIADAMAYAHRNDVVHRDLKPENVMLSDRHAMVTDFGVAKALTAAAEQKTGTTAGVALGTPTYMAPEQGSADPHLDHRADIYAFGVIAYELLTGQPPFVAPSPQSVLAAHLTMQAEPVENRRPSIPPALAALVMKCLQKKPADRPQSANELLSLLESLSTPSGGVPPAVARRPGQWSRARVGQVLAGSLALAVAGLWFVFGRDRGDDPGLASGGASGMDTASIAIMECQSSDQADAFLTEGFTQQIISRLAQVGELTVINASSTLPLSGSGLSTRQVADTLNVRYVFTCRVTEADSVIRVFGQLEDAHTSAVHWARPFERDRSDASEIGEQIAQAVAGELVGQVGALRPAATGSRTSVEGAAQAYLLGNYHLHKRRPEELRAAIDAYSRAIELDPRYAPPYAGMAAAYGLSLTYMADVGREPYEAFAYALRLSSRAIELDSTLAEAYAMRGYVKTKAFGPSSEIAADFARALQYGPNSADVHGWYAHFLHREGEHVAGLAEAERAITLDPIAPGRRVGYALDAIAAGRYARASSEADHALELEPGLAMARMDRAIASLLNGAVQECLDSGASRPVLALCLHSAGDVEEARAIADSIEAVWGNDAQESRTALANAGRARDLASYYGWTGNAHRALLWLERAFALSPYGIDFRILRSPLFEPVASAAGFRAAVDRFEAEIWQRTQAEWERAQTSPNSD